MIYVVSGLPRSGTSLMMQMLAEGGLPVLTDEIRQADDDNPRGYYELERVKKLKEDSAWLADAEGKVIKVISMLLFDLPDDYAFRVIFMTRNMTEILASQARMLERRGVSDKGPSDVMMREYFEEHLKKVRRFIAQAPHLEVMEVDYNTLISDAGVLIPDIAEFTGHPMDHDGMRAAIDQRLYRQRRDPGNAA
jgi:hypothetical protein